MSKVGLLKARKQGRVSATVMMQISQRIWPLLSLAVFSASFATEQTVDRWMYIEDVPIGAGCAVRLTGSTGRCLLGRTTRRSWVWVTRSCGWVNVNEESAWASAAARRDWLR